MIELKILAAFILIACFAWIVRFLRRETKELTHFEFMQEASKPIKGDMAQHYYE